jgi:hypothetical protein
VENGAQKFSELDALNSVPSMLNSTLSSDPSPVTKEYVKVLPASGSVALSVPTTALTPAFSSIDVEHHLMWKKLWYCSG